MGIDRANSINAGTYGVVTFQPSGDFDASPVTQYYILAGDAGNLIASIAPSTAGFVLTSNGAAAYPSFQAPAASGAMVLLQSQTASSSASISFSSTYITSTYKSYLVTFQNVVPATNGVTFQMDVSTNNGTTYLATGYDSFAETIASGGLAGVTSTTNMVMTFTNDVSNSAAKGVSGNMYLYNLTNGVTPSFSVTLAYERTTGPGASNALASGFGPATTTVNNIRFAFSSGNISTGVFSLYGIST